MQDSRPFPRLVSFSRRAMRNNTRQEVVAMLALSLSITYSRALSHNTGETRPRAGIEAITSVETLRVALSLPLSRLCPIGRLTSFSRIDQIPINLSLVEVCQFSAHAHKLYPYWKAHRHSAHLKPITWTSRSTDNRYIKPCCCCIPVSCLWSDFAPNIKRTSSMMKRSLISLAIATRPFSSTSQIAWNNTAPRTAVAAASASANTYKPSSTTTKPRTAYARVAKPATNASSFRKTIPTKALAPAPSQPSEPSLIDVNVSDDAYTDGFAAEPFPDPQPASEIPDYARLAPPVDFSGSDSSSSSPTAMDTRLYESPAPQEARAPVGEDWTTSFYGLSAKPFAREVADVLLRPLAPADIEIKPGEHLARHVHMLFRTLLIL